MKKSKFTISTNDASVGSISTLIFGEMHGLVIKLNDREGTLTLTFQGIRDVEFRPELEHMTYEELTDRFSDVSIITGAPSGLLY